MKLYVTRHGLTEWNELDKKYCKQTIAKIVKYVIDYKCKYRGEMKEL